MMYKIVNLKFKLTKIVFIVTLFVSIIFFSNEFSNGILRGLYLCGEVLIPSLFPFMILANFIINCNSLKFLNRILSPFTKAIFGVDGSCSLAIILSLIGGYPVGAKSVAELKENKIINENTAKKLSYSLVGSGPGFLIVYVGNKLLKSTKLGLILFCGQILSVIFLGLVNKYAFKGVKTHNSKLELCANEASVSDILIKSIKNGTYSIIEMCGTVLAFSGFINIFKDMEIFSYVAIFLEVTTATQILANNYSLLPLAFSVGFGGLCVHFQIFQILKNININKLLFFFFRILQGLVMTLITYLFISFFSTPIPTFSTVTQPNYTLSTNIFGSCMLLVTGISFIYTLKNSKE